jgi:hypothetical protein
MKTLDPQQHYLDLVKGLDNNDFCLLLLAI